MSRLSWVNDPHGCFADQEYDDMQEARYAAHLDEHEAYPQKECEWCEAERAVEEEEALDLSVCCGKGFIDDTDICCGCHEHSSSERQEREQIKELAFLAKHTCERCGKLVVPGFYCIECGETPDWRKEEE